MYLGFTNISFLKIFIGFGLLAYAQVPPSTVRITRYKGLGILIISYSVKHNKKTPVRI